jgi:hypothetical protein
MPMTTPAALPMAERMNPSITIAPVMRSVDQPIAARMPISRVRSSTAIRSVLRTMRTPIRRATHAMDLDTARKRPIMLSLRSTFSLFDADKPPMASMSRATRSTSAGSSGCASLTDKNVTAPGRKGRSASGTTTTLRFDDRVEARDPHNLKLLSQEADSVTCVLLHGAGEVDADQCDLAFVPLRKPALFERNILPKETILRPTRGKHVLIPIGSDKRNKLGGDGDDTGNLGNACAYRFRNRSAEEFSGSATSDREVGAVFLDALLQILLHALR